MKGQQKSPDDDGDVPIIDEGAVATADDPTAITTIQSAATFSSDQPIKYLFKTEGGGLPVGELYPPSGQVTYRVIQVSDGQVDGQTDGASAVSVVTGFPATTQTVTQAVFSQSEGLEGEASETHYYYPVTDATQSTMVENVQAPETLLTQSTPTGQLYVMMSPQDVLGGTNQSKSEPPRTSRDDKRRAQHNEVERRRRDKINNWIVQLSKTIPDCTLDATKNGQVSSQTLFRLTVFIKPASFYGATRSRVRTVTTRGLENEPELRGSPKLKVFWFQCIFPKNSVYSLSMCRHTV
ncbi:upstream stimulatory factor 1 isoform X3 [Oncorhynchus mykiss]|uniref:upstream stimulatory factor 1 isoform X3 n=1 Tax=Oncorhynchus mykiss TaxID=8022 RepID=UPI001877D041|nr:upstream stimulatory factor 1 isoform X3 [Oncorhynchus mykiss]